MNLKNKNDNFTIDAFSLSINRVSKLQQSNSEKIKDEYFRNSKVKNASNFFPFSIVPISKLQVSWFEFHALKYSFVTIGFTIKRTNICSTILCHFECQLGMDRKESLLIQINNEIV